MLELKGPIARYGVAALFGLAAIAVRLALNPWLGDQLPFITFFAAVAVAAWYGGVGPGAMAAVLLYGAANLAFMDPRFRPLTSAPALVALAMYAVSCGTIIAITHSLRSVSQRAHDALERASESEQRARNDLHERARAEEQLRATQSQLAREVEDLARLYELSSRLEQTRTLDAQLHAILVCAARVHGASRGLVPIYDPTVGRLIVRSSLGFESDALEIIGAISPGAGACGLAFAEGQRITISDTQTDPRFGAFRTLATKVGFRAVHSVPLVATTGEILGALSIHLDEPRLPTQREMDQADLLARKAAIYIQRARADEARRESEARLAEADRRKDEFLATLAHELRNPLAPIRNAVRFLQIKGTSDPDVTNAREMIDRQVRHMVRLVDDLLDVSRVTLGQIHLQNEVVSLALIATNAVEATRPAIDSAQHQLTVSLPHEPVYIEGDSTRLAQILQNLLQNAAKYTPSGGNIELSATCVPGKVRISVRDNGIGIRPDMLERVFEMFTQIERAGSLSQGGLGIGLSLAQRLANMHGGHIEAHSAGEGLGSHFTVVLPTCAPPPTRDDLLPVTHDASRNAAKRRVLVVDDNVDAAESLRLVLELAGHDAKATFDGESALELARQFRPHIVFLDLGMPKVDGFTVCRWLRNEPACRGATLVALTGWGQNADRERTAAAGFDHHLVKPADPRLVEQVIAGCSARNVQGMA